MQTFDEAAARRSVETFGERLEMMVLGFIDKHRARPIIVMADARLKSEGWQSAFLDAGLKEAALHPDLAELARHGARAWRLWTVLEPDAAVLTLKILALNTCSITLEPRTPENAARIARVALERLERTAGEN